MQFIITWCNKIKLIVTGGAEGVEYHEQLTDILAYVTFAYWNFKTWKTKFNQKQSEKKNQVKNNIAL